MSQHARFSAEWDARQGAAEAMIPLIGELVRRRGVTTSLHGRSLINQSAVQILKAHRFARRIDEVELPLTETLPIVEHLASLPLAPASIDIAQLAHRYRTEGSDCGLEEFLSKELASVLSGEHVRSGARDVVLYGFGRIGRLVARLLIEHGPESSGLRLRAVVVRRGADNDLVKRASLLRRDSVHGPFNGTITVDSDNDTVLANGTLIQFIYSDDPASVDYTAYGIADAIVVDNTGRWRDEAGLSRHLRSPGTARVLLTAPGKGDLKNIVFGVNHSDARPGDAIVTAASCTTNAITPVLKVIDDYCGVDSGHIETVHSFTNDQNLIDNFHKGDRRGRAATLNMVITETGAAEAVAKALPQMAGRLSGSAIRVPTPDVSLAILKLRTRLGVNKTEINAVLRTASLDSPLRRQVDYVESPEIVSTDILGSRRAGVVDGLATVATDDHLVIYVWYDNEYGYSTQVVRLLEHMAGGTVPHLPAPRQLTARSHLETTGAFA